MANLTGIGYSGENFSVERELRNLDNERKLDVSYYVFVTDSGKKKDTKTQNIIHKSFCQDANKIEELYQSLLSKGLKDMGIKPNPKTSLSYLYIINKN